MTLTLKVAETILRLLCCRSTEYKIRQAGKGVVLQCIISVSKSNVRRQNWEKRTALGLTQIEHDQFWFGVWPQDRCSWSSHGENRKAINQSNYMDYFEPHPLSFGTWKSLQTTVCSIVPVPLLLLVRRPAINRWEWLPMPPSVQAPEIAIH